MSATEYTPEQIAELRRAYLANPERYASEPAPVASPEVRAIVDAMNREQFGGKVNVARVITHPTAASACRLDGDRWLVVVPERDPAWGARYALGVAARGQRVTQ